MMMMFEEIVFHRKIMSYLVDNIGEENVLNALVITINSVR